MLHHNTLFKHENVSILCIHYNIYIMPFSTVPSLFVWFVSIGIFQWELYKHYCMRQSHRTSISSGFPLHSAVVILAALSKLSQAVTNKLQTSFSRMLSGGFVCLCQLTLPPGTPVASVSYSGNWSCLAFSGKAMAQPPDTSCVFLCFMKWGGGWALELLLSLLQRPIALDCNPPNWASYML